MRLEVVDFVESVERLAWAKTKGCARERGTRTVCPRFEVGRKHHASGIGARIDIRHLEQAPRDGDVGTGNGCPKSEYD